MGSVVLPGLRPGGYYASTRWPARALQRQARPRPCMWTPPSQRSIPQSFTRSALPPSTSRPASVSAIVPTGSALAVSDVTVSGAQNGGEAGSAIGN